jgi:hypothetical protein
MKTTKLTLALAGLMFASAVLVSSCHKKEAADTDTSGAADAHLSENTSSDIVSMGAQVSDNTTASLSTYRNANNNQILGLGCATIVRDTVAKTVTVTFNGGTCADGRTRSGSITYSYANSTNGATHYRDPGFQLNVTSSNYVVDGNAVTIENKTITNTTPVGFNAATTNETWSITASITINKASGGSISWTCNRVKTLLNTSTVYTNAATPINWRNARVGFTGSANGSRSVGETFIVNITSQLVRDFGGCDLGGKVPFIEGTFTYAPTGKAVRTFDYGDGSCDFNATVTINGVTHNITLP